MKIINQSFLFIFFTLYLFSSAFAGGKWYNYYNDGVEEVKKQNWPVAIEHFKKALKIEKTDRNRARTYGMHFIEYFPHREIGICFYHIDQHEQAKRHLQISLKQQYSARAQEFMNKLKRAPQETPAKKPVIPPPVLKVEPVIPKPPEVKTPEIVSQPIKLVGERMRLAVLPFQTSGLSETMGDINVVEQMMTTFYGLNRFILFERSQLELILKEQQLGQSGIIDASTAAQIGRGIGVDAIVLGSVARAGRNISISARFIDAESAEIITAHDEINLEPSMQGFKNTIQKLTTKISEDIPLVDGYVIQVEEDQIMVDIGREKGIKKGMKCIVYREGQEIIHPITKKVLGKKTEELCVVRLTQVYPKFSVGTPISTEPIEFRVGDKIVTK